jgi:hypothetical protein
MHTVHLGIAKDVVAQVAVDLCRHNYMGPGTLDDQLKMLWLQYRRWCKRNRIPYSRRRFSAKIMGVSDADKYCYPEMNSRTKAAHMKPLIRFLAHKTVTTLGQQAADVQAELRSVTIWGLAEVMFIFDRGGVPRYQRLHYHHIWILTVCTAWFCFLLPGSPGLAQCGPAVRLMPGSSSPTGPPVLPGRPFRLARPA